MVARDQQYEQRINTCSMNLGKDKYNKTTAETDNLATNSESGLRRLGVVLEYNN
jgi:hypothetical protein